MLTVLLGAHYYLPKQMSFTATGGTCQKHRLARLYYGQSLFLYHYYYTLKFIVIAILAYTL
jgi:hypothetical protein